MSMWLGPPHSQRSKTDFALARWRASSASAKLGIPAESASGMVAAVFTNPRREAPLHVLALKLPNSSIGKPREENELGGKGLAEKADLLCSGRKLYFITPCLENQAGLHPIRFES